MIDRVKEVNSLEGLLLDGAWLGEPVEGTDTGREVVARCEVRQIAAVAAEHDLTQVNQAVDGLLDGGEDPRRRPLPMFHLAMVLEEGDVVDCRLDAEHAAVLVVHLDRGTGEAVFDAGSLDASGKLRTDLLGQLRALPPPASPMRTSLTPDATATDRPAGATARRRRRPP